MTPKAAKWLIGGCIVLAVIGGVLWFCWKRGEPRRNALHSLAVLQDSLNSSTPGSLPDRIVLPPALKQLSSAEQSEFLFKTLRDEISPEGFAALQREARFGPLKEIFPTEADRWAQQAGVKVDDCVALKAERNGVRAEVVLFAADSSYRVIRCNNVKQLALR